MREQRDLPSIPIVDRRPSPSRGPMAAFPCLLAALFALSMGGLAPQVASAQELEWVTSTVDGRFGCGEQIEVDLWIDGGFSDLRGSSLVIEFDPLVLTPLVVTSGALLAYAACPDFVEWLNPGAGSGLIEVDLASLGCSVQGPGSILHMVFAGVGAGTSPLRVASAAMRDGANAPLVYTAIDGEVGFDCGVTFVPPGAEFVCPDPITIEVHVDAGIVDLRGMSFEFAYDPTILRPIAVTEGSAVLSAGCPTFLEWFDPAVNDGSLAIDLGLLGCSLDGPGAVLAITFEGLVDGTSTFECTQSILRNHFNQNLPSDCVATTISYSCPVALERARWGPLKARYR